MTASVFPPYCRLFILTLSTMVATLAMALPLLLNFTILTMTSGANATSLFELNGSDTVQTSGTVSWTRNEKSMALSSFAWSATICVLPLSFAMQLFGVRIVFTISSLVGAISTAILPLVALNAPYAALIVCRFAQGLGYCGALPMLGMMTAKWASIRENGRFMSLASCSVTFAPLIAMPVAGAAGANWQLAFYILACVSASLTLLWTLVYRNSPADHCCVGAAELAAIGGDVREERKPAAGGFRSVPWSQLLRHLPVWAIIVTTFGNMMGMQLIIIFLPTYLKQILKLPPDRQAGILCIIPYIAHMVVKIPAGFLSDKCCGRISETVKVRIYNTIALVGMAVCFVALAFLKPPGVPQGSIEGRETVIAMALFSLASGVLGFNVGSFFKSVTLVARRYSGVVMGLLQMTTCVVIIIEPFIVNAMTSSSAPNDEVIAGQWRNVFLMTAAALFVTNGFFCIFGSGEPAPWTVLSVEKGKPISVIA